MASFDENLTLDETEPINTPLLHQVLEENHLIKIYNEFHIADKRLNSEQLKILLENVANISYSEEEWTIIFMKMNYKRDGSVTWDDFISYLLLGFSQDEIQPGFSEIEQPITGIPQLQRSGHCYPINKITYFPTVYPDRTISYQDGSVLTLSSDGTVNYWSLDLDFERSVKSNSPCLTIQSNWITDMVALPDVSVVCLSSTERDLRFYDTSARKFDLRVFLVYLPDTVTAMYYYFSKDINEESKLLLGDMKGNIHVMFINSFDRGPFKSKPGMPLLQGRFEDVVKGLIPGLRYQCFGNYHTDHVRQLNFYPSLKGIISCSDCTKRPLVIVDISKDKKFYRYNLDCGVWCFGAYEGIHLLATGGSDLVIRLWNPFVPSHPTASLHGHHQGIVSIVIQEKGTRLYSLSQDKCIKVWDVPKQCCIQTYLGLPPELGEHNDLTTFYNPKSRQWIIGCSMLAMIKLNPKKPGEHTDGTTHTSGVSVVLYNPLHKAVVTCGLDSRIITWNPWDGRKMMTIENAHTKSVHAKIIPIEITSGAFDPGNQRLLTGAQNGTLKIWNFNTGICLRNMKLDKEYEIKCLIWIPNRILAMGWNRYVCEFSDGGDRGQNSEFSKNWILKHDEDISAAVARQPQTLATSTYDGELIMWTLETGQPYKRFNVSDPTTRIKIQYNPNKVKDKAPAVPSKRSVMSNIRKSTVSCSSVCKSSMPFIAPPPSSAGSRKMLKRLTMIEMPDQCIPLRRLSVHCMLFLTKRNMAPNTGTLLVALENGSIQVWSHHSAGGFITSFYAIHKAGDYIISMATDKNNEFLFTGTIVGYIKTWLLINYCTGDEIQDQPVKTSRMLQYRLMFPYLWGQFFTGRAQRLASTQPKPLLLNSHKAHLNTICCLIYIDEAKLLISSSTDCSARMWTLGGRYIQTLGTFKPWKYVPPTGVKESFEFTMPMDLKRVVSATSYRVLNGGHTVRQLTLKQLQRQTEKQLTRIDATKIYGVRLKEPYLGEYFKSASKRQLSEIKLDSTFSHIPIYQHLITPLPDKTEVKTDFPTEIKMQVTQESYY